MNITYTWNVLTVKVLNEGTHENAVVHTRWQKVGVDENGNRGLFIGATPFTSINVPDEEFIPFNELTEETVLSWIQNLVVGDYETYVNKEILKQIQEEANPPQEVDPPWVDQ